MCRAQDQWFQWQPSYMWYKKNVALSLEKKMLKNIRKSKKQRSIACKEKELDWSHQAILTGTESDKVTVYRGHQILWGLYFCPLLHWEYTFQGHKTGKKSRLREYLAMSHESYWREGLWKEAHAWICWEGNNILCFCAENSPRNIKKCSCFGGEVE